MAITQQRVIRSTSCLVLGWVFFSKDRLTLFNLAAHELHELYYYDIGILLREALDRLRVRLNMYLVLHATKRPTQLEQVNYSIAHRRAFAVSDTDK